MIEDGSDLRSLPVLFDAVAGFGFLVPEAVIFSPAHLAFVLAAEVLDFERCAGEEGEEFHPFILRLNSGCVKSSPLVGSNQTGG